VHDSVEGTILVLFETLHVVAARTVTQVQNFCK